jgi:hypothetical protein
MSRPATLGLLIALSFGLALGAPAVASAAPERPVDAQLIPAARVPAPAPAAAGDSSRYAQREQNAPKTANYEGGSMVVIGVSGGALVVALVVLLLIL